MPRQRTPEEEKGKMTTFCLSISEEDKMTLKEEALKRKTTSAQLIREYISGLRKVTEN